MWVTVASRQKRSVDLIQKRDFDESVGSPHGREISGSRMQPKSTRPGFVTAGAESGKNSFIFE